MTTVGCFVVFVLNTRLEKLVVLKTSSVDTNMTAKNEPQLIHTNEINPLMLTMPPWVRDFVFISIRTSWVAHTFAAFCAKDAAWDPKYEV